MRLPLVRRHGEILERNRRLQERLLLFRHALEVECGALHRLRPQEVAKRRYVSALDSADDLHRFGRQPATFPTRSVSV